MAIEKDIARIADALEELVEITKTLTHTPPTAPSVIDPLEGAAKPPAPTLPATVEQLRSLAADIVGALPDELKAAFTDFVRGQVCAIRSVRKLVEIPAPQIPAAAQEMIDWAKNATKK